MQLTKAAREGTACMRCVFDEDFRSDRIVSKLIEFITYETRYEAIKA